MPQTRVFIHGLESTSQGTKGIYFRSRYPDMVIEDFTGPLEKRMDKLTAILKGYDQLIIVGSSYGGLMAAIFAGRYPARVRKLILLAPALNLPDFAPYMKNCLKIPVVIYHGNADDVVPPDSVRKIAGKAFRHLTHHLVEDDHSLNCVFGGLPWDNLLQI
jgi:pimeloyl-ACP methyl ester carboxylesterase